MKILVSIDDTDHLSTKGVKGTGDLARHIAQVIEANGWGLSGRITRHQLLLHEDIPYTSHNSSMCFEADIDPLHLESVIAYSGRYLEKDSEPEADPGLCIAVPERLAEPWRLVDWGYKAKQQVLTKEEAYRLAEQLGVHLSEHGGTGQGVIGAMAGAGLRMGGNDGSFKDKHCVGEPGSRLRVSKLCELANVNEVRAADGTALDGHDTVVIGRMVKSVLLNGKEVILVDRVHSHDDEPVWKTFGREQIHMQQRRGRG